MQLTAPIRNLAAGLQSHLTGIEMYVPDQLTFEMFCLQSHLTGIEILRNMPKQRNEPSLQSHLTGIEMYWIIRRKQKIKPFNRTLLELK